MKKMLCLAGASCISFSALNATTSLEEAIKNVELSGMIRYRYDTHFKSGDLVDKGIAPFSSQARSERNAQRHRFLSYISAASPLLDNVKSYLQLSYESSELGYGSNSKADTSTAPTLRQIWFNYDATENIRFKFGRQVLHSIWNNDAEHDGLAFMGVSSELKVNNFNFYAAVVDSIDTNDGDLIIDRPNHDTLELSNFFAKNWYILSLNTQFHGFKPELWVNYAVDRALFYALDLKYDVNINENFNYALRAQYLGNSVKEYLKVRNFTNGSFFGVQGTLKGMGFDTSLGALFYGDEEKRTLHTLEDGGSGRVIFLGEEAMATVGSSNYGGYVGKNRFAFFSLGYTFDKVFRVGGEFVIGGTKTNNKYVANASLGGGKKIEYVLRTSYKYSKNLDFYGLYSIVNVSDISYQAGANDGSYKNNKIRLQVRYRF